ncbi:MAG: NFACT family protein [Chthonomonas sp.]|nr:NFACT family protein [Chthonomonas sp.]
MKVKRLRFDAWCLRAVVLELQSLVGIECQNAESLGEHGVALQFWDGRPHWVHIRSHPDHYGIRLGAAPPRGERMPWVMTLRRSLNRATLVAVEQIALERLVDLVFDQSGSKYVLTCELMGKNSNIILRDADDRVASAARFTGKSRSERAILPGRAFERYPREPSAMLSRTNPSGPGGLSPFVQKLLQEYSPEHVLDRLAEVSAKATLVPGFGVTPIPLSTETLQELFGDQVVPKRFNSISEALAEYESAEPEPERESLRHRLRVQLERIEHARATAVRGLEDAADTARRASELQERGNLILAYQGSIQPGDKMLKTYDEQVIPLNPELTPVENAEAYFLRARKAKHGSDEVNEQLERMRSELVTVRSLITLADQATTDEQLLEVKKEAATRNWLQIQVAPQTKPKDRPFEGHAIKELLAPGGYAVFYGENSDANDFLTMRMGKPNDWWLHVRGAPSTHVLIRANNQPERVPKETLTWAAVIAAKHSPSKHAQMVPVDYTLKRYVRRPKGSKPGFVTYTHEKTIHVNPTGKT